MDPGIGNDIVKSVENLNQRFAWIWLHDLAADVRTAEARFEDLAETAGAATGSVGKQEMLSARL
jgi:salicylate hydroxylase